jgi:Amidohydrolase family
LYAGSILDTHGVPVAYKSDHAEEETNAKYLMSQAAMGHWFFLVPEKSLQAVTSVPAKALDLDYRIGYARPGYDADLVVWDAMPLALGATPLQVYIDGIPQLDHLKVEESMGTTMTKPASEPASEKPKMRVKVSEQQRDAVCSESRMPNARYVITGITKSFMADWPEAETESANMTLVLSDSSVDCFGPSCEESVAAAQGPGLVKVDLSNGYLLPGLTAITACLGMIEISTEPSTGDGFVNPLQDITDPLAVGYAKYGVMLKGKAFARARMGGITRAISPPPHMAGFMQGVSVGILTGENKTLLDGGIFQNEIALHVHLDLETKVTAFTTISDTVKKLRQILSQGQDKFNGTAWGRVASGDLPLIIVANNQFDIQQVIMFKKDFPHVKVILQGGSEAPFVAKELADAKIPVILTKARPAPAAFRHKDAVVGPPLTPSVARYLNEAGVFFAISVAPDIIPGDYRIHTLALEAAWAAKYAQLGEKEMVKLVTSNVETILGLKKSKDFVIWEGNPFEYGGAVALSFHESEDGKFELSACWPDENDGERMKPRRADHGDAGRAQ